MQSAGFVCQYGNLARKSPASQRAAHIPNEHPDMTSYLPQHRPLLLAAALWGICCGALAGDAAHANDKASRTAPQPPAAVSPAQYDTARQTASQGVPLDALAPNAPATYTVVRGDTLWKLASTFLKDPWRWPQLWGMNMQAIRNPHLIYPGQVLYLVRDAQHARLQTAPTGDHSPPAPDTVLPDAALPVVHLSPKIRSTSSDSGPDGALPIVAMHLLEPFLSDPEVTSTDPTATAARIVSGVDTRSLITRGDTIYARGSAENGLMRHIEGQSREYRIVRRSRPLLDPQTGTVLGYESLAIGQAQLLDDEAPVQPSPPLSSYPSMAIGQAHLLDEPPVQPIQPMTVATLRVTRALEEIAPGDRLLPMLPRRFVNFVPHAPLHEVDARIVALNTPVRHGAQHQIITINQGERDGIAEGMVLNILSTGRNILDQTDPSFIRARVQLPDRVNGQALVFRSFDRVSYALVMQVRDHLKVGDRLSTPH